MEAEFKSTQRFVPPPTSCWHFSKNGQISGVTGGGGGGRQGAECPPQRLLTGKFLLIYREKRGKEKREKGEKWSKLRRKEGKL